MIFLGVKLKSAIPSHYKAPLNTLGRELAEALNHMPLTQVIQLKEKTYPSDLLKHNFTEVPYLVYLIKGQQTLYFDGKEQQLLPGSVSFFQASSYATIIDGEDCEFFRMTFDEDLTLCGKTIIRSLPREKRFYAALTENPDNVLMEPLLKKLETGPTGPQNYLLSLTSLLLWEYSKYLLSHRENGSVNSLFSRVCFFIKDNAHRGIDRESTARAFDISPGYLSHLFQTNSKEGFQEMLIRSKIRYAKDLMRNGLKPMHLVAANSGFNSLNYFSQAFKKQVGMGPKTWSLNNSH